MRFFKGKNLVEKIMEKKIPIVPYKELGLFCGTAKPKYYEIDKLAYLAVPTKKSYKVKKIYF